MNEQEKKKLIADMLSRGELVTPQQLENLEHKPTRQVAVSDVARTKGIVNVDFSYRFHAKKSSVQDFVAYYNNRFQLLSGLLRNRRELTQLMSISRIENTTGDRVSFIGMVSEIQTTKNDNLMITFEDPTGKTRVIVTKTNQDLYKKAKELVHDEVVGIMGSAREGIFFANEIILPEVPVAKEFVKGPRDVNALFLSDIHVGSNVFMGKEFDRFLHWINGKSGSASQREEAAKVSYIFIAGDVVDGIGIFQDQQHELHIKDIQEQYNQLAELLSEIPQDINIIISPGNHDAVLPMEPQPAFDTIFCDKLHTLPNVTLVSNPGLVTIEKTEAFPGLKVLMYHGYSFDYYIANVDSIRQQGGYDRSDLIMKFLLKRRHLAPTHTSTLYVPDTKTDPLFINEIPDIFHTGHVHRTNVSMYRNISLVNSSCWQGMTPFQARLGHNPQPARVPLINLQSRKAKILRFG